MHRLIPSLAIAALAFATPALAAPILPGTQVVDTKGQQVGTVSAVNADSTITVNTGTHQVSLPVTSFTPNKGALLFALSRAELDAKAAADESVAVGKPVKGTGGTLLGTIEQLDDQFATLKLTSGQSIKLPRNGISGEATGAVAGISLEQLQAQLSASAPAPGGESSQ